MDFSKPAAARHRNKLGLLTAVLTVPRGFGFAIILFLGVACSARPEKRPQAVPYTYNGVPLSETPLSVENFPTLMLPKFESASSSRWLSDDELVVGVKGSTECK